MKPGVWIGLLCWMAMLSLQAQESSSPKGIELSKFKPIVHLFANAEYNPSAGVTKDYSFWMGRTMVGFNYQFDSKWSARILIDRTRLSGSMNTMYVKVANLRWSPVESFALEAGAINQNNFGHFETFYGYRFVAEVFQDRYYYIPSSDLGVAAYFRPGKTFSFDAAITNGEGPRIDQDAFGQLKFAGGMNIRLSNSLNFRIFNHLKSNGSPGPLATEHLINANLTYQPVQRLRLGADFTRIGNFMQIQDFDTWGGTLFGSLTLYKSLQFIARYDRLMVQRPAGTEVLYDQVSSQALITGLSVSPLNGIRLCINYQGVYADRHIPEPSHRLLFSFEYRI